MNILNKKIISEKFITISFILIITILGFLLRVYRVGIYDFYEDEFQVMSTAMSYYKEGKLSTWDWDLNKSSDKVYNRAWLHTMIISLSYKIFGFSEFSARIPSVLIGTFLIPIGYLISNKLFNKKFIAVLFSLALTFDSFLIAYSRIARMYIFFILFFLIGWYYLYKLIINIGRNNTIKKGIYNKLIETINFKYLSLSLIFFLISYVLHINTIIFIAPLIIFLTLFFIISRKYNFLPLTLVISILFISIILLLLLTGNLSSYTKFITLRIKPDISYINEYLFKLFSNFIGIIPGIIISLYSIIYSILKNSGKQRILLFYIFITLSTTIIFFIFFSNRYAGLKYMSNIYPLSILLITYGIYNLLSKIKFKSIRYTVIILFTFRMIYNFIVSIPDNYILENKVNYTDAYQIIEDSCSKEDAIWGQYLRINYLGTKSKELTRFDMLKDQTYTLNQLLDDLDLYKQGWIVWDIKKSYHLKPEVIDYIDTHFEKVSGEGIDDFHIEIYRINN